MDRWTRHLAHIANSCGVPSTAPELRMVVQKIAGKLFWGRMRQFVRLRNQQINQKYNDKNVTLASGTQVETSRLKRKRKKAKTKSAFKISEGLSHNKTITDVKQAQLYMQSLEEYVQNGQKEKAKEDVKWMYQMAYNSGQLSLLNGESTDSHFRKKDIWKMLLLWDATPLLDETMYSAARGEGNLCVDMYNDLLRTLQIPQEPADEIHAT